MYPVCIKYLHILSYLVERISMSKQRFCDGFNVDNMILWETKFNIRNKIAIMKFNHISRVSLIRSYHFNSIEPVLWRKKYLYSIKKHNSNDNYLPNNLIGRLRLPFKTVLNIKKERVHKRPRCSKFYSTHVWHEYEHIFRHFFELIWKNCTVFLLCHSEKEYVKNKYDECEQKEIRGTTKLTRNENFGDEHLLRVIFFF